MMMLGINNIYGLIWDFDEWFWRIIGFSPFGIIKWLWPGFAPWLFGKMINRKGIRIK